MLSRRSLALSIVGSLVAATPAIASAHGHTAAWQARPATYGINKTTNVSITMDDGVVLKADVLRPAAKDGSAAPGTFPVILTQTPYNKNSPSLNFENDYLIQRGYIQVIVDVRGTGSSGGQWQSFSAREQKDYYECAVWAHKLKGGNGDVGLSGTSYGAIDQLLTAAQHPPGLKAEFPIVPTRRSSRRGSVSSPVLVRCRRPTRSTTRPAQRQRWPITCRAPPVSRCRWLRLLLRVRTSTATTARSTGRGTASGRR
jgi:X-Pro dipeptidyl-peptidase-like protein